MAKRAYRNPDHIRRRNMPAPESAAVAEHLNDLLSPLVYNQLSYYRQLGLRVREHLQEYYGEDIALNHLAQVAALSPYYLSRVFHAEVGITLREYQLQVRIDRAKSLLTGGMTVRQVAAETGFVDQSHLTRYFKRLVQTTPGSYRLHDQQI